MTKLTVSEHGVDLITRWEGKRPRLRAKRCLGDKYELSYGITFYPDGSPVRANDVITWERHLEMFRFALSVFERDVRNKLEVEVNQHQFDALVCLDWNIGAKNFAKSSVLKYTNQKRWEDAAEAFGMWKYATTRYENDRKTPVYSPLDSEGHFGKNVPWKVARRGLVRRHYAEGGTYLGWDMSFLHEDVDLVEIETRRDWHERGGYYKDAVLFQTPFQEILGMATERLEQPVYENEQTPLAVETKKPEPVAETKPKPKPRAKKIIQSRTIWGGSILAVVATPQFQSIAEGMAGSQQGGILGTIGLLFGWALVVVGRVGAAGPIEVRRAES